jgi:hypothetical protein
LADVGAKEVKEASTSFLKKRSKKLLSLSLTVKSLFASFSSEKEDSFFLRPTQ